MRAADTLPSAWVKRPRTELPAVNLRSPFCEPEPILPHGIRFRFHHAGGAKSLHFLGPQKLDFIRHFAVFTLRFGITKSRICHSGKNA
jgi:hypothetical protein